MRPRTFFRSEMLLYFSNGEPNDTDSLAICRDGVILRLGGKDALLRWSELDRVEVEPRGDVLSRAPTPLSIIAKAARLIYGVLAAALFIVTFGVFGGDGFTVEEGIRVVPYLRGKPEVFAIPYEIPTRWPRKPTDLEQRWVGEVMNAYAGIQVSLDIDKLSQVLSEAASTDELKSRLREAILPRP